MPHIYIIHSRLSNPGKFMGNVQSYLAKKSLDSVGNKSGKLPLPTNIDDRFTPNRPAEVL